MWCSARCSTSPVVCCSVATCIASSAARCTTGSVCNISFWICANGLASSSSARILLSFISLNLNASFLSTCRSLHGTYVCKYCNHCVAVCCCALQGVAVCSSVLQCVERDRCKAHTCANIAIIALQCIVVCCSVLQCVAVCCSVLQCVERDHCKAHTCASVI